MTPGPAYIDADEHQTSDEDNSAMHWPPPAEHGLPDGPDGLPVPLESGTQLSAENLEVLYAYYPEHTNAGQPGAEGAHGSGGGPVGAPG